MSDTIAAIATAPGRGGISIIRVSGDRALEVAQIITGTIPEPRKAYFRKFKKGQEIVDEGVLLYFNAPYSYTGEDVIEFQGHGGNVVPHRVLDAILSIKGIRQAEAGEFTKRAFLNGKMDLTKAEAVEDLISSSSESAAKAALSSLEGIFSDKLNTLLDSITNYRVRLEACLDFPEEHEDFFDTGVAKQQLQQIVSEAQETLAKANFGIKLTNGAKIVLVGSPNAGKSSLLNALAGVEKAIVTNIPGTTRDTLSLDIEIGGIPVTITDTAGIRDTPSDEIEAIGINKAIEELSKADLVLFMVDSSKENKDIVSMYQNITKNHANISDIILIKSKADLESNQETLNLLIQDPFKDLKQISISTKIEDGLSSLYKELNNALGTKPIEGAFTARNRHKQILEEVLYYLEQSLEHLDEDIVICARDLMIVQEKIGEITGKITSDDILGKIFSTFCIGK